MTSGETQAAFHATPGGGPQNDAVLFEAGDWYMGVSKNNGGAPKSSILIGLSNYKPSILGYPYFWKHQYIKKKPSFLVSMLDFGGTIK